MKFLKRLLIYSLLLFIWLPVLALILEVYSAKKLTRLEHNYKTIKTEIETRENKKSTDIAQADAQQNGLPQNKPVVPLSPETAKWMLDENFGGIFLGFEEEDRNTYVTLKNAIVVDFDRQGHHTFAYASPQLEGELQCKVGDLVGKTPDLYIKGDAYAETTKAIEQAYDAGEKATIDFDLASGLPMHLLLYPVKDTNGTVNQVVGEIEQREKLSPDAHRYEIFEVQWFKFKKNIRQAGMQTNNLGWRDDDVVLPKPVDVYRIACIGGSCVAEGATNNFTYPSYMERSLNEQFKGSPKIEVVNCGVFAISTSGEKRRLFDYLELQPNLMIDYNGQNEFGGVIGPWTGGMPEWKRWLKKSRFVNSFFNKWFLPSLEEMKQDLIANSIQNLKAMNDYMKKKKVILAVCSFARPDLAYCSARERDYLNWSTRGFWVSDDLTFESYAYILDTYNDLLKKFCQEEGIPYIPVAEEMKGGLNYFVDICHMTQEGIPVKAGIIGRHVQSIIQQRTTEQ